MVHDTILKLGKNIYVNKDSFSEHFCVPRKICFKMVIVKINNFYFRYLEIQFF